MQWNALSRKTIGIIITLVVFFAGAVIFITVYLIRQRGGDDIAKIVQSAVEDQRITSSGEGLRVVSDRLLMVFRPGTAREEIAEVARKAGVSLYRAVENQPDAYVVAFPAATVRQLRQIIETLKQSPDVLDASMIPAE